MVAAATTATVTAGCSLNRLFLSTIIFEPAPELPLLPLPNQCHNVFLDQFVIEELEYLLFFVQYHFKLILALTVSPQ
jgi:hypothetical protein